MSNRPFVSVKFSPVGRTYSFLIPELALDDPPVAGEQVIVQSPSGPVVGTVMRGIPRMAEKRPPAPDATVIRRATKQDIVSRLKHQQREQEAHRICQLKIKERGLAMKLTRVEHLFDGSRI